MGEPRFYSHNEDVWFGTDWDGEGAQGDFVFLEVGDEYNAGSYAEQLNSNPNIRTLAMSGARATGGRVDRKTITHTQEEEKSDMEDSNEKNGNTLLDNLKESGKVMANAAWNGAKMGGVHRASDVAYDKIAHHLEKRFGFDGDSLQDPTTKKIVLTMLPMIMLPIVTQFEDNIPYSDFMKQYCELQIQASFVEHGSSVVGFVNELVTEMKAAYEECDAPTLNNGDYAKMTVVELKKLVKQRNVALPSSAMKKDLISILQENDAKKAVEEKV